MTKTPHKHAEAIKAWADGEEIEYRVPNNQHAKWIPLAHPAFSEDYEYRVKRAREYPETLLGDDETYRAMYSGPTTNNSAQCRRQLVNVALRHAIDNGQVVTREEFDLAIGDRDKRDMAVAKAVASSLYWVLEPGARDRCNDGYLLEAIAQVSK